MIILKVLGFFKYIEIKKGTMFFMQRSHIGKLPFRYLTAFILLFLLCLATFLLWGRYAQTEVVTGMLVPSKGETRIHSGGGGLVANLQVAEGQSVQQGDLLFTLRSVHSIGAFSDFNEAAMEQIEHLIQLQKARIAEQNKLHSSELKALQVEIADIKNQIQITKLQAANQGKDIKILQQQLKSQQQLLAKNYIAETIVEDKKRELLVSTLQSNSIEKNLAELSSRLNQLQLRVSSLPNQQELLQLEAQQNLANLQMQLIQTNAQFEQQVKAPLAGKVSNIIYEAGDFIAAGRPVMTLLPNNSSLTAELYVPTRARGFLKSNQQVFLRFHAFPYQKYGAYPATIKEISSTVMFPADFPMQLTFNEPSYLVKVQLNSQQINALGSKVQLQPGMLLDAVIVRDRRTILEWIFEPILGFSKRA